MDAITIQKRAEHALRARYGRCFTGLAWLETVPDEQDMTILKGVVTLQDRVTAADLAVVARIGTDLMHELDYEVVVDLYARSEQDARRASFRGVVP